MTSTESADRVVTLFFSTVAVHLGLYDPKERAIRPESELRVEQQRLYRTNKKVVEDYLENGWSVSELTDCISAAYKRKVKIALLSDLLVSKPKESNKDFCVLVSGEVYYHPVIRGGATLPAYERNPDGTLVRAGDVTKFADKLTKLSHMVEYAIDRLNLNGGTGDKATVAGTIRWLLSEAGGYNADVILFAIDAMADSDTIVSSRSLMETIQKFLPEAEEYVEYLCGGMCE